MTEEGVIGKGAELPWHLPADMAWFKKQTMGKPVLMGRKTFQSIGKSLPGRNNIILTRQAGFRADGCTVVNSIKTALKAPGEVDELMVIGGADCYGQMLPLAGRLYLTIVHGEIEGDVRFPEFDRGGWREIFREERPADEENGFDLTFLILERDGKA